MGTCRQVGVEKALSDGEDPTLFPQLLTLLAPPAEQEQPRRRLRPSPRERKVLGLPPEPARASADSQEEPIDRQEAPIERQEAPTASENDSIIEDDDSEAFPSLLEASTLDSVLDDDNEEEETSTSHRQKHEEEEQSASASNRQNNKEEEEEKEEGGKKNGGKEEEGQDEQDLSHLVVGEEPKVEQKDQNTEKTTEEEGQGQPKQSLISATDCFQTAGTDAAAAGDSAGDSAADSAGDDAGDDVSESATVVTPSTERQPLTIDTAAEENQHEIENESENENENDNEDEKDSQGYGQGLIQGVVVVPDTPRSSLQQSAADGDRPAGAGLQAMAPMQIQLFTPGDTASLLEVEGGGEDQELGSPEQQAGWSEFQKELEEKRAADKRQAEAQARKSELTVNPTSVDPATLTAKERRELERRRKAEARKAAKRAKRAEIQQKAEKKKAETPKARGSLFAWATKKRRASVTSPTSLSVPTSPKTMPK